MKAYNIVTIEREYASGGTEIGRLLSERLGIPSYGNEILEYLAKKVGVDPERLGQIEEGRASSFLYSLYLVAKAYRGEEVEISNIDELNVAEQLLIEEIGDRGKCILIGRASGWVLRERDDVLNIFITADKKFRKRRAVKEYGIDKDVSEAVVTQFDKRRAGFFKELTGLNWNEKGGYDMVLDSSKLGIETCAEIIADVVEKSRKG